MHHCVPGQVPTMLSVVANVGDGFPGCCALIITRKGDRVREPHHNREVILVGVLSDSQRSQIAVGSSQT